MPAITWHCDCGAKHEVPETAIGRKVRCSRCGVVSIVEKPSTKNVPPPLPMTNFASREGSGTRPIVPGHSFASVISESKKPKLSLPVKWTGLILGSVSISLLLLLLILVFVKGDSQQLGVETEESALAKQLREHKEESLAAEAEASRRKTQAQQPSADASSNKPTGKALELADLAVIVGASVVQVNVTGPESAGTGSGFVLDKRGTIVTNYHVIEGATAGTIVFSDRTIAPITGYLGVWPDKDIALVQVDCSEDKLHPMLLATSAPRQGERVAAFGSPLGLQQSVSEGIVSAVRESEELKAFGPMEINARLIQTTTPISKGNSGGPLVNMQGLVVGVNTMTFRPLGGENINFAVAMSELPSLVLAKSESATPLPAKVPEDDVQRIVSRGRSQHVAGNYDRAIADFTEAIRLDPKNFSAFTSRGFSYLLKGDNDLAIADLSEAIRLAPTSVMTYALRGDAYQNKRDFENAFSDYTEVIRRDPMNPVTVFCYAGRGNIYRDKGDFVNAISDYTEAIRRNPQNAAFYSSRGKTYQENYDDVRAIADFTEAIRLDPENAAHYASRGDTYLRRPDYDSVVADYTTAIRLNPINADYYSSRGSAYMSTGKNDLAIADYTKAIRLNPVDASALFGRGRVYRIKGDYDSSIADYTDAIRIDPKNSSSFRLRGEAYREKGDYDLAIADFTEAIRLNPTPTDIKSEMEYVFSCHGRGESYRMKRDYNKAIADFTDAIGLSPHSASNLTSRGDAYREKGNYDNAIADYTEVIRLDPKNAEAYGKRGETYKLMRQQAASKRDFEQATKLGYKPTETGPPVNEPSNSNSTKNDSKIADKESFPDRVKVRDQWKKIVIGMPYPKVEKLLGRPNDVATFGAIGASWTYRYDWTPYSGRVEFDGNGQVKGWSEPVDWKLDE